MTDTEIEHALEEVAPGQQEPCMCQSYLRATERAALAAARWLGRADQEGAEEAAAAGMRTSLDLLPIRGRIVFGSYEEPGSLLPGETIGAGGVEVDLALDPLEGRGVVARGGNGAMSMIAVGEPGHLITLPDMYMRKLAVGPRARGSIDLLRPVAENVEAIADAFGRRVNDITTIVLDRPRHHDLIEEIRNSGARIKLIQDGDVTAAISAAIRGTNDHLAIGIGGTRQAVLSAAALRCLGGELQAQFWPTSRREIDELRELGVDDYGRVFSTEDLASGEVIVAATGVSNGDLLRGVRYLADSARTHSLLMCTRCNWVRFVDGIHFFARERREEVRLLGF
ncbi:MAG TPA: class II fructose-bisphosphatase [Gaiellaceae bacterium]|jgi:fructose-1,6-bisphosphatase II|nr:class II fructose-bisphosphatase [Gaiellaceae bacterium]